MPKTTTRHGIPITTPLWTLVDLATALDDEALERAVNNADQRDLIDPERLRAGLDALHNVPGAPRLKAMLDRHTFVLTDSELEQRFRPIARRAGLGKPLTRHYEDQIGRIDFMWPELGLVVEVDGLRYHRTPAQQTVDHIRDQKHAAAGRTPLRFTHFQITYEPAYVEGILTQVARRLMQRA